MSPAFPRKLRTLTSRGRQRLLLTLIGLTLLLLLSTDGAFRGTIWHQLWSVTGEEQPLAQWRATVEYLGNALRAPVRVARYAAIQHAGVNPYGVNTFLQLEVDPANVNRQLAMIAAAGFQWIRQEFPWEDIEIHARGDFQDRRNLATVGEISSWDKYDRIVSLAEEHGLTLQVRLSNPPAWSRANPNKGDFAPPDRLEDFVEFAATVAERYRGRIHHYQIWNEPNIYPEWGEQPINPEDYTHLLCLTHQALKAVDPHIIVISGALAPTNSLDQYNLSDLVFLQRMYDAGAGECFDVLSLQGYGLFSGPTDRRLNPNSVNYSRNLLIRDLMVANHDAHKAIWFSEAAWNPVGEAGVPRDLQDYDRYGVVTDEQAARYMPLAYQRAAAEWPWLGVINYWFFRRPNPSEADQSYYYFRMVEPDWRPLPIYDSLRDFIAREEPLLPPGHHQAEHWAIRGERHTVPTLNVDFGSAQTLLGEVSFRLRGTAFALFPPPSADHAGPITTSRMPRETTVTLCQECPEPAGPETFYLSVPSGYILDAVRVYDRGWAHGYPLAAIAFIAASLLLWAIGSGSRERRSYLLP
ncbi:MAG: hypothetical protein OXF22_05000 [Anaerolineaceae bacterium]|nr:hypothetical protein [Anaerolineaceae bacterium]